MMTNHRQIPVNDFNFQQNYKLQAFKFTKNMKTPEAIRSDLNHKKLFVRTTLDGCFGVKLGVQNQTLQTSSVFRSCRLTTNK